MEEVIEGSSRDDEPKEAFTWTMNSTLMFLDVYKKLRGQVGTYKIKKIKRLFEVVAGELSAQIRQDVLLANCENRRKVLERGYKKYLDNANKTGRGRKEFEYSDVMSEILGKKNIVPEILLSAGTVDHLSLPKTIGERIETEVTVEAQQTPILTADNTMKIRASRPARLDVLKEMRMERRNYYKKRLEIEEKKLEEKKRKIDVAERRNEIEEKKLEAMSNATALLQTIVNNLKPT